MYHFIGRPGFFHSDKTAPLNIDTIESADVPEQLQSSFYFDFQTHPFQHQEIFCENTSVIGVLKCIGTYSQEWIQKSINELPSSTQKKYFDGSNTSSEGGRLKPRGTVGKCVLILPQTESAVSSTCFIDYIIGKSPYVDPKVQEAKGQSKNTPHSNDKRNSSDAGQIFVGKDTEIVGVTFDVSKGNIWIGEGNIIRQAHIAGPCIIGSHNVIRPGAFFRGNVIIGDQCTLRGELKNVIIMDQAELCHPSYCGDSICGFKSHFGNQATTANISLFACRETSPTLSSESPKTIILQLVSTIDQDSKSTTKMTQSSGRHVDISTVEGNRFHFNDQHEQVRYDTGLRKLGTILGDLTQIGCNSVLDPGCLLAPNTIVYPLTRLARGFYGPNEVIKNKPEQCGAVIRHALK